ncbi:MAG: hypothetical protein LBQ50_03820 [Planctomycetaceae bacterium]|jgi:hypothetical protein|nr:hypothetical protein [Planctomycetaceae bacterium]
MKLVVQINQLKFANSIDSLIPDFLEISDEDEVGMFYLFYYDNNKTLIADYCFFSLDEAKEQANFDFGIDYQDWKEQ